MKNKIRISKYKCQFTFCKNCQFRVYYTNKRSNYFRFFEMEKTSKWFWKAVIVLFLKFTILYSRFLLWLYVHAWKCTYLLSLFCHYHLLISCKFVTYVTKEISKNNKSPIIFLWVASFTHYIKYRHDIGTK